MSKGSLGNPVPVAVIRPAVLPLSPVDRQGELFPLTALTEMPNTAATADAWGFVEASDSHIYLVKTDVRGGKSIRASEWIGTKLAEELNMPCPTPKIIQLSDGQLGFGSRVISGVSDAAKTSQILTSTTIGVGAPHIPGLQALLSALYTFDMFIKNVDRHDENYLSIDDRGTRRFYAIDFGRSLFWHGPLDGFPLPTQWTRMTFKKIIDRHGFDLAAANAMLDRLAKVGSEKLAAAFSSMPDSWLERSERLEFTNWWENGERLKRIETLREGLSDGSLL